MKKTLVLFLIISLLLPSLVLAFAYEPDKPLAQYPEEGIFLGVAAGLARKTGIEPIYFRVGFVLSTLTGGIGLFAYFILVAIMPTRYSPEPFLGSVPKGPPKEGPPKGDETTPKIYFEQVNNIMREIGSAGNDLTEEARKGKIVSQTEYFRRLRDITIEGKDKFNNLTVPSECKEIYQLFSEYFRYSILSTDVVIEGLESGDKEKRSQAEIKSKAYSEKADELYNQAKSKILNWGK